jgi:predicted  nucleic acid-binding Zn-ribbon protein
MCDSNKIECPRCGGSGKTEFSHVVEGVCFMCSGSGEVFPKRVEELTKKAKVRKANKEAKRLAKSEAAELIRKEEENKYNVWQYNRNLDFIYNSSFIKNDTIKNIEEDLIEDFGSNVSKEDVIEFLSKRRFKKFLLSDQTNTNKWIAQTYGFLFFEVWDNYDIKENANLQHNYK